VITGLAGGGAWAFIAAAAAALAVAVASRPRLVFAGLLAATVGLLVTATADSPAFPALSGLLFLGSVTSEMILGHWFLIDPKLPRWPLFTLAVMAGGLLAVDAGYVIIGGWVEMGGSEGVFGLAYLALTGFTGLLVAAVWMSLREPRYSGVMAATGLSYLAVLTSFGVVTLGRALIGGGLT
jgi:hypothetical protein